MRPKLQTTLNTCAILKEHVSIKPTAILLAWVSGSVSLSYDGLNAAFEVFPPVLNTVLKEMLDKNACPGFFLSPGKFDFDF